MSTSVRRLFSQFQPEHYNLQLQIDPDGLSFTGSVIIEGKKTGRPSQRITLHQKGLKIDEAFVRRTDGKNAKVYEVARVNTQKSFDELRIHTSEMLYPGEYNVMVNFSGKITRNMEGIYPCFFKHDGQDKKLIATQFESHHAREAFPCIDEPEAKATFDLVLKTPETKAALSNTPVKNQAAVDDLLMTEFERTPRMSTYLLAFVFGDLEYLEAKTKDGVAVRTYATPDNVKHTEFALDVAVKCLDFYNDYFDTPYPLAKCDFIALPDFASGAMENWGCITFREQAMLVDPANTSLHLKQYVANVVAHELTHQWFGNLVTMQWWNDLWLNESFASWMSYLAVDSLFPDWQVWTQFVVDEQLPALKLDALEHTHAISVAINHPDEIRTIFDAISYEKGASVLHMLHGWLGADNFRDGLRTYLKKHAYANTVSADLWAAWEAASKKPVGEFMAAWTTTPGYPLVYAGFGDDQPQLMQERFYLNPAVTKSKELWPVPLLAEPALESDTLTTVTAPTKPGHLLNAGRGAFYRVAYDSKHIAVLAEEVRSGKLGELDRLGLLSDTFELAKAGYGNTIDALKLLEAYTDEDSTVVWDVIAGSIGAIRLVMNDDQVRESFKPAIRKLVSKQLERLGWDERDSDSHFDLLLRPTILGLAAAADEPSVIDECKKRFAAMNKPEDLAPDLRGVVYNTVARLGGQPEFDKLWAMHNASANSEERVTLSSALTSFEKPEQIELALSKITTDDVRLQDAMYWIAYSLMNRFARQATWQWLQDNWDWLKENCGNDLSFYRMPTYVARVQSDATFLPEFEAFFGKSLSPAFERPIKQGIETIQWQSAWRERELGAIRDYLASL